MRTRAEIEVGQVSLNQCAHLERKFKKKKKKGVYVSE